MRVAVAVSGGPDSIGLLAEAIRIWPGRVVALTVDHGLRAEAAAEAVAVAAQCAARTVPHVTLVWTGPKPSGDVHAAARAARYALMRDWCEANGVGILLTAHHVEDQAETLLMRLARGSGSAGLAAVRSRRLLGSVALVRPVLGLRRADLAVWAGGSSGDWAVALDPSNGDERFDRVRMRGLLARESGLLPPTALAATAGHLAAVEAALEWAVDRAWEGRCVVTAAGLRVDAGGLPGELRRRLTVRAIGVLMPGARLRGAAVMRLIERLDSGLAGTLAGVKARPGAVWQFEKARNRRESGPK